jgi:hypothetical protein
MMSLTIEVHDDDWPGFLDQVPETSYGCYGSGISLNYTRVVVHDPDWVLLLKLKYPWINWQDAV